MGKYETLIDIYESWDLDSLVEEGWDLSSELRDDIARKCNDVKDPLFATMMVGAYFMDADGRSDGDEDTFFRRMFKGAPLDHSGFYFLRYYREYNWKPWVEDYLRRCYSRELEVALRWGIVVCSADGFVTDVERERILRWE